MYPGIRPKPKLASGSAIPTPANQSASGSGATTAGALAAGAGILSGILENIVPEKQLGEAVYTPVGATTAQGVLKGAAAGASIGSIVPGIGTAIGAGVGALAGGVMGLMGGNKAKKQAEKQYRLSRMYAAQKTDAQAAQTYQALPGNTHTPYMQPGGKLGQGKMYPYIQYTAQEAVLLGGQRHHQKGEWGKGNPGVTNSGEKVVEVEKGELLLTTPQTQDLENLIQAYQTQPSAAILRDIGGYMQAIVKNL